MSDRLLRASATVTALAVVWFGLTFALGPVGPVVLGWFLPPAGAALSAALCWRTAHRLPAGVPARPFWRWVATGLAVFVVATVVRLLDSVHADLSVTAGLSLTSAALHGLGLLIVIWPLFRLPLGARTRAGRWAFWLDIATLMMGAAIFLWHLSARPLLSTEGYTVASTAAGVVLMAGGLIGVFVVAKVALTGSGSLAPAALRILGAALAFGGLGSSFNPLIAGIPYLDSSLLIVPVGCFLIGYAAHRHLHDGVRPATTLARRRRYSLLPYAAVAATDALAVGVGAGHSSDALLITVTAVAMTGLVVGRQLVAFRENETLFARLAGQEKRYRVLVQNSSDLVAITDASGRISYISDAVHRVLGSAPEDLLDRDMTALVHPGDLERVVGVMAGVFAEPGATATYRLRMPHADGSWRWLEVISANLMDEPSVAGIVSNARDVTETVQVQERLRHDASHDALTGLANRTLFATRVAEAVGQAGADASFSVVVIDLDDFKATNDTLGHAVGDELLVHVAQRMLALTRPIDTVARLGGDEFAILFDGATGHDVEGVLRRIAEALLEPAAIDGHMLSVRASFGVVDGRAGDDAGTLMRHADIAMYEAKNRGDGGFQRYETGMQVRVAERGRLAESLATALVERQFVLHYQPVVTLPEGRITGVEALVRWEHPKDGLLGPGAFIDAAEQTGLIVPLGRWVLREATRQAARWRDEYGDDAPATVAVNVSARQLREPGFAAEVADALEISGLPAHRLTIEITESVAVGGGATRDTLRALRELGVRLSLDDFGTGASTLSLLATCPVDQIKLDRSFAPAPGVDAIATAVMQLARAFGVEAVAEGVETPAQAHALKSLGYRRAQGFHFARPMSSERLGDELSHRASRVAPVFG